jgi:hypothetical protein
MHHYDHDREQGSAYTGLGDTSYPGTNDYAVQSPSPWLAHEQTSGKRSKWLLWGGVATAAALIVGGIVAGIAISSHHHSTSSSSSSSDPSKFTKNPALKSSFYGFGYTPLVSSHFTVSYADGPK